MAHAEWCGKCQCGECELAMRNECELDLSMSCSPSCENLGPNGDPLDFLKCIKDGCDAYPDGEKAEYLIDAVYGEVMISDLPKEKKDRIFDLLNELMGLIDI